MTSHINSHCVFLIIFLLCYCIELLSIIIISSMSCEHMRVGLAWRRSLVVYTLTVSISVFIWWLCTKPPLTPKQPLAYSPYNLCSTA